MHGSTEALRAYAEKTAINSIQTPIFRYLFSDVEFPSKPVKTSSLCTYLSLIIRLGGFRVM